MIYPYFTSQDEPEIPDEKPLDEESLDEEEKEEEEEIPTPDNEGVPEEE